MNCKTNKLTAVAAALCLALAFAATASAQVFTGRVDITIEDSTGGRLPGVNVDITGPANQTQVTDAQGQAHFLNLPVGTYTVKANLSGFNPYSNANVQVATGGATPIAIKLAVAGTQETVTVTAATPVIDTKKQTTTTNVTLEELQNIPTRARSVGRDADRPEHLRRPRQRRRLRIRASSRTTSPRAPTSSDNTWNIDGIPITDMGATGSSPTYYDFDMFQEMAVTTGGADAQNPTPGVQLNMVLKKGTNTLHGDGSIYFENEGLQGNNMDPTLAQRIGGSTADCAASGFTQHAATAPTSTGLRLRPRRARAEGRIWVWGTNRPHRRQDPHARRRAGQDESEQLRASKPTAQSTETIARQLHVLQGNKKKNGRGAGRVHPPETTWIQTGPTTYLQRRGQLGLGQNLFADRARHATSPADSTWRRSAASTTDVYVDDAACAHGSFYETTPPIGRSTMPAAMRATSPASTR